MELTRTPSDTVNVPDFERWASVIGGGMIAIYGFTRGTRQGALLTLMGGGLVWRGVQGHSRLYEGLHVRRFAGDGSEANAVSGRAIHVERTVTIERPISELWRFWRQLENLPRVMKHLESVLPLGGNRFHWTVRAPIGTVEWDAEIIGERENDYIAWRSLEGSDVDNAGSVHFRPAPGTRGTEVRVALAYKPPAGPLGAAIAKLFGREPEQQVRDDLRRFKQVMEAGEAPTPAGQPHGRRW